MPIRLAPVELVGKWVQLRPLKASDLDELYQVAMHAELWAYTLVNGGESRKAMHDYLSSALQGMANGFQLPFVQLHAPTQKAIGSTRLVLTDTYSLEVGWSWVHPDYQRTGVNTESKYLLLEHAFERLGADRVQLKTDDRNLRSQNAILRIGAKFEGVLRNDRTTWTGHRRSTHIYSILASEWPSVKIRLQQMMLAKP